MRKFALSAAIMLAALGTAQPARAQARSDSTLHVASRIRVQSPVLGAKARTGSFVSLAADTLVFTLDGQTVPTRIAVAQVSALELSVPRKAGIIRRNIGGIIGAGVGGVIGLAAAGSGSGSHSVRTTLGLAGAVGGYFLGRLYWDAIGARGSSEQWIPVAIPARGAR